MFYHTIQSLIKSVKSCKTKYPEELTKFVIILEDRRFKYHFGIDPISLLRAILNNVRGKSIQGASTIEMQLVRTFTQDYKISLSRKIRESFIALILSITCEKYLILNYYLSICYFGDDINGAEKFAKIYFNKEIFTLKRDQLAICAAVIKHPLPKKVTKQWQNKISQRSTHAKSGLYSLAQ